MNLFLTLLFLAVGATNTATTQPDSTATSALAAEFSASPRVVAYYFHATFRCGNCLRIEDWAESTIRTQFAEELRDSTLQWSAMNIDEPENEHFIDDFKLSNRSVVLVELAGGEQKRWKTLEAVWDLLDNETAFRQYIREETRAYLDGK